MQGAMRTIKCTNFKYKTLQDYMCKLGAMGNFQTLIVFMFLEGLNNS